MQDIWASGIGWDDQINNELYQRWRQWSDLFPRLDMLQIPRCYFTSPFPTDIQHLQIHVFVDASEAAFACVAYFRLASKYGVQVSLVGAKTKVAPLKPLTIPKLELKAAVLGVRFLESTQNHHTYQIAQRFLWSDSTTVLSWINSDHRRYTKFVAFRIGEILSVTNQKEWRWVPSKMNAADEATRWNNGPNLRSDSAWFRGPSFLYEPEEKWPLQKQIPTTQEEIRSVNHHCKSVPLIDVSRFSRWTRLHRTIAYIIRFIDNLHRKKTDCKLNWNICNKTNYNGQKGFCGNKLKLRHSPQKLKR